MDWIFRAKIHRIESCHEIQVMFDLGWRIKYRDTIYLDDFFIPENYLKDAKDCLIVMCGGHRVIVKTNIKENRVQGRVYLYYPVTLKGVYETVGDRNLVCVNKIMSLAEGFNYNADEIKSFLKMSAKPKK